MFVILVHYLRPLAEVDALLAEHRAFLAQRYASGHFLVSGRREPRDGGVILARAASRAEVEAIVTEDPFHQAGLAEYQILEFTPTMAAPELSVLMPPA